MGYDMYWVRQADGEAEALAAAEQVWEEALKARDLIDDQRGIFDEGRMADRLPRRRIPARRVRGLLTR
ncbi:hypothetical protein Pth03_62390 [Planotetraspora thailandica]|uniref:Uncharacterized protein n=1 Tax=Planotetraspora thailandica TaxID=487172 RepID=A0A8J3V883_9ACTN|nr:hypothetical protein [Planotetraspora thailandica]GII57850.1 hypothetical protein Pth03_62390 [Planotetraspora thailandica]